MNSMHARKTLLSRRQQNQHGSKSTPQTRTRRIRVQICTRTDTRASGQLLATHQRAHTVVNPAQGKRSEPECITRQNLPIQTGTWQSFSIARWQLCGITTTRALALLCCTTNIQSRPRSCAPRISLAHVLSLHCSGKIFGDR